MILSLTLPRSSRSLAVPRVPAGALGLFMCLAGALAVLRPPLDPDLGWHLRTGQIILASHRIPTTDPFSYTKLGAPWVEHEWLWQAGVAALHAIAGNLGIVLGNGATVGASLALLYLQLRLRHVAPVFAAAGIGVALIDLAVYAEARPAEVVALFSALFLYIFERYRCHRDWRWLLAVPAGELVWANCHGSFLLGLLLCAVYGLAALWETRRWAALIPWALTGLGAAVASVVNPLGINLYRFTLAASQLSVNRRLVNEWRPPDFRSAEFAPILVTLLLLLALPAFLRVAPRGRAPQMLLVVGALAVLQSQQFILFFAVIAAPIIGELLEQAWPRAALATISRVSAGALGLVLAGLALVGPAAHLTPAAYRQTLAQGYPVDAVDFIERHELQGPMWNGFDWGGFLIGALPRLPVFVDGRTEMYGETFEADAVDMETGVKPIAPVLDEYGIKLVLVDVHTNLADEMTDLPGWHEAYRDSLAAVFTRGDEAS
ncbi:MAG TPA: hypothetical protein VK009_11150 [Chloroflexota bacterium]|nr:hypothetical protein [Chloroflexota bacterium]